MQDDAYEVWFVDEKIPYRKLLGDFTNGTFYPDTYFSDGRVPVVLMKFIIKEYEKCYSA